MTVSGTAALRPSEGMQKDLVAGKTISQVLGEIVWLLSQHIEHRNLKIRDIETLVMPAIVAKQFQIHYLRDLPIRVEVWAMSDAEDAVERIRRGDPDALKLWRSGATRRDVLTVDLRDNTSPRDRAN